MFSKVYQFVVLFEFLEGLCDSRAPAGGMLGHRRILVAQVDMHTEEQVWSNHRSPVHTEQHIDLNSTSVGCMQAFASFLRVSGLNGGQRQPPPLPDKP